MSAGRRRWRVRLAAAAEADFQEVVAWTTARFGRVQARVYARTLMATLDELTEGPSAVGVTARDDIADGILTLHAARSGRRGRHLVVFRVGRDKDGELIDVLRILHDAMDLPRHIPEA